MNIISFVCIPDRFLSLSKCGTTNLFLPKTFKDAQAQAHVQSRLLSANVRRMKFLIGFPESQPMTATVTCPSKGGNIPQVATNRSLTGTLYYY